MTLSRKKQDASLLPGRFVLFRGGGGGGEHRVLLGCSVGRGVGENKQNAVPKLFHVLKGGGPLIYE